MKRNISDLKHEAAHLNPTLNMGKSGITVSLVDEIIRQLKRNRLVKVRMLRSSVGEMDRRQLAEELSRRTGSQLVEIKGSNAVLYRD